MKEYQKTTPRKHMGFRSTLLWGCFLWFLVCRPGGPVVVHAIEMKGVSYTAWSADAMSSPESDAALEKARDDGCTWMAICVWWFQDNVNSTVIAPDPTSYSASTDSIIHAIETCHDLGMKVMLKPMIDCKSGDWRGTINPSAGWFTAYHGFINTFADLAETYDVELFCVGCELKNTIGWSTSWVSVIDDVRSHYDGPLVYAANHDSWTQVGWWGSLDYIGIDAYFPLTTKNNPTLAELQTAWNTRANTIESWRNTHYPDMDVIFTEVGYQSVDGTNRTPNWTDPATHAIDLQEQVDCYEALLSQCRVRDWWVGAFWWNWETDPDSGGVTDPYWTPMNKPAEQVLRDYYITIPGDFDDDRDVDVNDLLSLTVRWLDEGVVGWPDVTVDHQVDLADFAEVSGGWLETLP